MKYYAHFPYFIAICRFGSLSKAATEMGISQCGMSYQIERLEQLLATQLLIRSRGKPIELTPNGRLLLDTLNASDRQVQQVLNAVSANKKKQELKITAPVDLGTALLAPLVHGAGQDAIRFRLDLNDNRIDLSANDIDLALRRCDEKVAQNKEFVFSVKNVLVTSKAYQKKHGIPDSIGGLIDHKVVLRNHQTSLTWSGLLNSGRMGLEDLNKIITINNSFGIASAVQAGAGIAILPEYMANHYQLQVLSDKPWQNTIPATKFEIIYIDTYVGKSYADKLKKILTTSTESVAKTLSWHD
jgi:DNA-binding transcriptional LysR family regulator